MPTVIKNFKNLKKTIRLGFNKYSENKHEIQSLPVFWGLLYLSTHFENLMFILIYKTY